MDKDIRTWLKCEECGFSWYIEHDVCDRCLECGSYDFKIISEERMTKEGMLFFEDKDIATIEAMHDLLLDHGHSLNERALKESRELTHRMYKSLKYSYDSFSEIINKGDQNG